MTTTSAAPVVTPAVPVEETTEDFAKHSSVGLLVERINKAVKRNPAMPVGELWQFHLRALIEELHRFHIDYADEAAEEAAEEAGGANPGAEYMEALAEFAHDAKDVLQKQTTLLLGALVQLGFVNAENGTPTEAMPPDVRTIYEGSQQALAAWLTRYPSLVSEGETEGGEG